MKVVTLDPELIQQIELITGNNDVDAQVLVETAVRAYLVQIQREKIENEMAAFDAQFQRLKEQFLGQYVAVHEGKIIDHDPDVRALHLRVFERLSSTPVLLKQVTKEPERALLFRSPRLERNGE